MEYISQKQSLLQQILQNTQLQTGAIEQDDMTLLQNLITAREKLMHQVDVLDQQAVDIIPDISNEQLEPLKQTLAQIVQVDNANQALMQKEFEHVKSELRKIRLAKQQGKNYGNEYGIYKEEGIFFDTKEYRG